MAKLEIIPESIILTKMSDETYFSDKYKDYISNSRLGLLDPKRDGSIEKYLKGFDSSYSDSFALGTAVHNTILQPDYYTISDIQKPNSKLGVFVEKVLDFRQDGLTIEKSIQKASKVIGYYSGKMSEKRIKTAIKGGLSFYLKRNKLENSDKIMYLSKSVADKYEKCIFSLGKDQEICNTLKPQGLLSTPEVFNEYAILCDLKVTLDDGSVVDIKAKAKIDNFTLDHEENVVTLNDLKTTGRPVSFFMGNKVKMLDEKNEYSWKWIDGSFQKYSYYRQIGMYLWLLQCAIQKEYGYVYKSKANMLVVETIPNFSSKMYSVEDKDISKGLNEMKRFIIHLAEWINKK